MSKMKNETSKGSEICNKYIYNTQFPKYIGHYIGSLPLLTYVFAFAFAM